MCGGRARHPARPVDSLHPACRVGGASGLLPNVLGRQPIFTRQMCLSMLLLGLTVNTANALRIRHEHSLAAALSESRMPAALHSASGQRRCIRERLSIPATFWRRQSPSSSCSWSANSSASIGVGKEWQRTARSQRRCSPGDTVSPR